MSIELCSGTNTEFYVLDHGSQAAIMAKFRAFMLNLDFFLTPFGNFLDFEEFAYMLRNPPGASPGWLAPGLVTESGVSPDVENPCI